ncbi:hypothetical protein P8452_25263 [Trifolium repens]|nr:hypothetical protein P8452_25263 [Trifolium repens]
MLIRRCSFSPARVLVVVRCSDDNFGVIFAELVCVDYGGGFAALATGAYGGGFAAPATVTAAVSVDCVLVSLVQIRVLSLLVLCLNMVLWCVGWWWLFKPLLYQFHHNSQNRRRLLFMNLRKKFQASIKQHALRELHNSRILLVTGAGEEEKRVI